MFDARASGRTKAGSDFDSLKIGLASPERIRSWSWGEVTKPETINYRTLKPERNGLFCTAIFGPLADWHCLCGKYKSTKHLGKTCEKCGTEITRRRVRRERFGHIELGSPCSHIWFFKVQPSHMGLLLDIKARDLDRILYYEAYVVVDTEDPAGLAEGTVLSEDEKRDLENQDFSFGALTGAAGVRELLRKVDVEELARSLRAAMKTASAAHKRARAARRLRVVDAFRKSGAKPEWMVLEALPVLPPNIRPVVPMEDGRFGISDLNDLYRRVINRNNRLRRLFKLDAPEVILRSEKRMLQEAVDALLDNGRRGNRLRGVDNRPLKSLADTLKGRHGRFRQNLLGKRVDYSGRAVIVSGPDLKLHQCGLPMEMALELFKPFVYQRLEQRGHSVLITHSKELVARKTGIVWDALDEVIKGHPVVLSRAPTLDRLGVQAFEPVLVNGKAIRIHPLARRAFRAGMDRDRVTVHVPLSSEAQAEAHSLMLGSRNILSPANGSPVATPTQDMALGIHYLTREPAGAAGAGRAFGSVRDVLLASESGCLETRAPVRLLYSGPVIDLTVTGEGNHRVDRTEPVLYRRQRLETTVGRVILNDRLPDEMPFVNGLIKRRGLGELVSYCHANLGAAPTVRMLEELAELGFEYATRSGLSIGIDDLGAPAGKSALVASAQREVTAVESQYRDGALTGGERHRKITAIWSGLADSVTQKKLSEMQARQALSPAHAMAGSAARCSVRQCRQLFWMRGLTARPSAAIIETPVSASFAQGLDPFEYFIAARGARKGLAEAALNAADSGYLTRRLADVAQDVIITEIDCGTSDGIDFEALVECGEVREPLRDRIVGRVSAERVSDRAGETVIEVNREITEELAAAAEAIGRERVRVRSVLKCETERGVCQSCYGRNLATGRLVERGEAVGIVAAQSIGEPTAQLTLRTLQVGGTATRVSQESRQTAKSGGFAKLIGVGAVPERSGGLVATGRRGIVAVADAEGKVLECYPVMHGAKLRVQDGQSVERLQVLLEWDPLTISIRTEADGSCRFVDLAAATSLRKQVDEVSGVPRWVVTDSPGEGCDPRIEIVDDSGEAIREYLIPAGAHLMIADGDELRRGDVLARIPRETTKPKDMAGGLPRVEELLEGRKPSVPAAISEIDGTVEYGQVTKIRREVFVLADDAPRDRQQGIRAGSVQRHKIPKGVHIKVRDGDRVRSGEPLTDGPRDPQDILDALGEEELQRYLVNEIQAVYRIQGVRINDKHVETVVRQMTRWVRVEQVGDTEFLADEEVDKFRFRRANEAAAKAGGEPAVGRPLLMGITKAALSTDSWVSAASFQQTARVLTQASAAGRVDELRGLKENVIIGRLIPAGTGLRARERAKVAGSAPEPNSALAMTIRYLSGKDVEDLTDEEIEDFSGAAMEYLLEMFGLGEEDAARDVESERSGAASWLEGSNRTRK